MKQISRRRFLKHSSATGSALAVLGGSVAVAPFSRALGANGDIRLAVVGIGSKVKIGGKGKADIRDFRKIQGVRIVALCDVDRAHLDPEVDQFHKWNEKVEAYVDVRRLLENKDIDAVSVTTPNHWHALVCIWACQAGKDVFAQKPASHNIFEGRKMVEAARKYSRIVQCTSGSRSRSGIQEALAFVRQGGLGKIICVRGLNYKPRMSIGKVIGAQPIPKTLDYDLWSGPAPVMPLRREYLHYDWHWDWLYGNGDLGNMGIHYMDGCRIAVGQDVLPRHVLTVGGRFGYEDDGQTPNTQITFLDYEPAPVIFEVRGLPKDGSLLQTNWEKNARNTMDSHSGVQIGLVVHCEHGYVANDKAFDPNGKLIRQFEPTNPEMYANFIEVVRSRRAGDLQGDILQGHLSAALVHMANISYRLGKSAPAEEIKDRISAHRELANAYDRFRDHLSANGIDVKKTPATLGALLTMDPATERFTGEFSAEANQLVSRDYREPFVVRARI
ncbi:MAG TPA: Gfo/Idh/MocA family oxidoreductase [Verrucomicrobiae bacterium]